MTGHRILLCLPLWAVVSLSSCSSESHAIPASSDPIVVPEMIDEDDTQWNKVDSLTQQDTSRLKSYFQNNPSVAENSIIHGTPLVYEAGSKRRRYYWVRPGIDGAEWLSLEFNGRNVKLENGNGPPFLGG